MMTLLEEIEEMFSELSSHELGGLDSIEYAAQHHCERWDDYEAERSERMEKDEAYKRTRQQQWTRANENRKKKRKGLHLTNADRLRVIDDIRSGRKTVEEVSKETGVSVTAAESLGQLTLWEVG